MVDIVGFEYVFKVCDFLGYGNVVIFCGNIGGVGGWCLCIEILFLEGILLSEIVGEVDVYI